MSKTDLRAGLPSAWDFLDAIRTCYSHPVAKWAANIEQKNFGERAIMNVRQAVAIAKKSLAEIFSEEAISNLGLEEVEFDEPSGAWSVTLGFSRPWDLSKGAVAAIVGQGRREYKIVRIDDTTEKLLSIKNREIINAE